jgi:hypothetical protein
LYGIEGFWRLPFRVASPSRHVIGYGEGMSSKAFFGRMVSLAPVLATIMLTIYLYDYFTFGANVDSGFLKTGYHGSSLQVSAFQPAAAVESWLTGVRVSVERD